MLIQIRTNIPDGFVATTQYRFPSENDWWLGDDGQAHRGTNDCRRIILHRLEDAPPLRPVHSIPYIKDWPKLAWAAMNRRGHWFLSVERPYFNLEEDNCYSPPDGIFFWQEELDWEPPEELKYIEPENSLCLLIKAE